MNFQEYNQKINFDRFAIHKHSLYASETINKKFEYKKL